MYPLIQNVVKFRSKCEKYKMDFCPELKTLAALPKNVVNDFQL